MEMEKAKSSMNIESWYNIAEAIEYAKQNNVALWNERDNAQEKKGDIKYMNYWRKCLERPSQVSFYWNMEMLPP